MLNCLIVFLLWNSSHPKGKLSFYAFIMNNKVVLFCKDKVSAVCAVVCISSVSDLRSFAGRAGEVLCTCALNVCSQRRQLSADLRKEATSIVLHTSVTFFKCPPRGVEYV